MTTRRKLKPVPTHLRGQRNADGSQTLFVRDAAKLRLALGDELLAAFACSFSIANRCAALVQLSKLSKSPDFEAAQTRNRFTIFFLSIGVAHEGVAAIGRLTKQLRSAQCSKTLASENYRELITIARRWRKRLAEQLRHKWAFHFDADCYLAGVNHWAAAKELRIGFVDRGNQETYFPFADDVLLLGTSQTVGHEVSPEILGALARDLWQDQNAFSARVFNAFCEALGELSTAQSGGGP